MKDGVGRGARWLWKRWTPPDGVCEEPGAATAGERVRTGCRSPEVGHGEVVLQLQHTMQREKAQNQRDVEQLQLFRST